MPVSLSSLSMLAILFQLQPQELPIYPSLIYLSPQCLHTSDIFCFTHLLGHYQLPLTKCKCHESREFCLFYSPLYMQHLELCLEHFKGSIKVCCICYKYICIMNIKTKMAYLLIKVECLWGQGLSHCSQWSEEGLILNRHLVHFYRLGVSELINNKIGNITRCLEDRERQGKKKEEQMTNIGIWELTPISHWFFRGYM